jgi:hypothetical protein
MINEKVLRKVVEAQTGRGVFEVEEDACIFFLKKIHGYISTWELILINYGSDFNASGPMNARCDFR